MGRVGGIKESDVSSDNIYYQEMTGKVKGANKPPLCLNSVFDAEFPSSSYLYCFLIFVIIFVYVI